MTTQEVLERPLDAPTAEIRLARAYLLNVAEPPAPALAEMVSLVGPVDAAERVMSGNVPNAVAQETESRRLHRVDDEFERAIDKGDRLIVPEDDEWPNWMFQSFDTAQGKGVRGMVKPLALWARGTVALQDAAARGVTMVGARASTRYGEFIASDWAYSLASEGVTVFSGAAYGIDGAAHRGALSAGGATVAALGCGLDIGYPAGHVGLLRDIADQGLIISEYPPSSRAARHRFLVRNRLLAALSGGTLVVEAAERSGARNTANLAEELGRPVMAVPGPVSSRSSAGAHSMIRSGQADLVTTAEHVLETIGTMGKDIAPPERGESRKLDGLSPAELRVHGSLHPRSERTTEQVASDSGIPLDKVRAILPMLEIEGLVERRNAGWRLTGKR